MQVNLAASRLCEKCSRAKQVKYLSVLWRRFTKGTMEDIVLNFNILKRYK